MTTIELVLVRPFEWHGWPPGWAARPSGRPGLFQQLLVRLLQLPDLL
eukprot:CAMPEP_0168392006 /NCGR_PEP_ID=MMETSP0228-20121227/18277_1 /TAXON_ID=133427 /ORGANISM="Protoceratium reticulatum, Strain CCCM 535 (=CCMP 1889)" /LENGTH=46 /DNA_ID= /DNA_START= /DNA_END= /DNA_ORIENTATION=